MYWEFNLFSNAVADLQLSDLLPVGDAVVAVLE